MIPPNGGTGMIHCPTCAGSDFKIKPASDDTPLKFHCQGCRRLCGQEELLIPIGTVADQGQRFSHPVRVAVMSQLLVQGEMSPNQLAGATDIPIGNVAYHMRRLLQAKVVKATRTRPVRGAVEHFYEAIPLGE